MNGNGTTRRGLLKLGGAAAVTVAAGGAAVSALPAAAEVTPGLSAGPSPAGLYLGTYTSAGGVGIAKGHLDPATGTPSIEGSTAAITEASWLATSPAAGAADQSAAAGAAGVPAAGAAGWPAAGDPAAGGGLLYAISEQSRGTVSALTSDLTVLSTTPTGDGPAHLALHPSGAFLFVSLYGGGAVVTHPVAPDGTVGAATDTRRQGLGGRQSHAHQVVVDPTGEYVLAVDLGVDTVFSYQLDAEAGMLSEVGRAALAPGSGPRHLAFHPGGAFAYVANELNSTVTVCSWSGGVLEPGQVVSAAPDTGVTNYPGEIVVSADGRFVYLSNRGTNTVGVFATGEDGATLERIAAPSCGGDWPRHLALDPSGAWLYVANQRSGTVTWLPIDPATGVPGAVAGELAAPGVAQILV